MKAYVDKNLCIGCGICESVCPAVFKMEDDGLAVAIDTELEERVINDAKDAEGQCPVDAITVT
ncbi:MAG: ferredoxin [Saccharofermentanales bacterium]